MKLIGITGGSGSGKTTFSKKMLELLPNSSLIDIDSFFIEETDRLEGDILAKLGLEKDENFNSLNHYFASLNNIKTWISTIEPYVVPKIENAIKAEEKNKDYIILDWNFLPLCNSLRNCNATICVVADEEIKLNRLSKRLKSDDISENSEPHGFETFTPSAVKNRVHLSALDKFGYESDYYIKNNGSFEEYYDNIEKLTQKIKFDLEK